MADELIVFSTFALRSIILELAGPFERDTGQKIRFELHPTPDVKARIERGEAADIILIARDIADAIAATGHLDRAAIHDVARSGIGVAIPAGAPRPDIGSAEAFKRMLLASRTVVYTDPASGGASGVHFSAILDRLGIADAMRSRTRLNVGSYNASLVAAGEADVAIQQIAELLPVEGAALLGPLPDELQVYTVFSAAIGKTAPAPHAAAALVRFLRSVSSAEVIRRHGMEPV